MIKIFLDLLNQISCLVEFLFKVKKIIVTHNDRISILEKEIEIQKNEINNLERTIDLLISLHKDD